MVVLDVRTASDHLKASRTQTCGWLARTAINSGATAAADRPPIQQLTTVGVRRTSSSILCSGRRVRPSRWRESIDLMCFVGCKKLAGSASSTRPVDSTRFSEPSLRPSSSSSTMENSVEQHQIQSLVRKSKKAKIAAWTKMRISILGARTCHVLKPLRFQGSWKPYAISGNCLRRTLLTARNLLLELSNEILPLLTCCK